MYVLAIIAIIVSILSIIITWVINVKKFDKIITTIICVLTTLMMIPSFGDDSYFCSSLLRLIAMIVAICYFLYQALSKMQDRKMGNAIVVVSIGIFLIIITRIMCFSKSWIAYLFIAIFDSKNINEYNVFATSGSALAYIDIILILCFDFILIIRAKNNSRYSVY